MTHGWLPKPAAGSAVVNRAHPLARGLEHAYLYNAPSLRTVFDAVGTGHLVNGSNVSNWSAGPAGLALQYFAEGNVGSGATVPTVNPPFTLATIFKYPGLDGVLISHSVSDNNSGYRQHIFSGGVGIVFGAVAAYSTVALTSGVWYIAVSTCTGNGGTGETSVATLHGGPITSVSHAVGTISGTPAFLGMGSLNTSIGSDSFQGLIAYGAHWSRALETHEVRALVRNPYAFLSPTSRRLWLDVVPAGGGGSTFVRQILIGQAVNRASTY